MKKQYITLILIGIIITVSINPIVFGLTKTTEQINLSEKNIQLKSNYISDSFFDLYIKVLMKIGHKPSIAAGIIYNDTLVWSKGYGYYDIENQKHATKDTLYLQASG